MFNRTWRPCSITGSSLEAHREYLVPVGCSDESADHETELDLEVEEQEEEETPDSEAEERDIDEEPFEITDTDD